MKSSHLKTWMLVVVLCGALLVAVPTLAQEAASGESAQNAQPQANLASLVLVVGLGAVVIVGGIWWQRDRTGQTKE